MTRSPKRRRFGARRSSSDIFIGGKPQRPVRVVEISRIAEAGVDDAADRGDPWIMPFGAERTNRGLCVLRYVRHFFTSGDGVIAYLSYHVFAPPRPVFLLPARGTVRCGNGRSCAGAGSVRPSPRRRRTSCPIEKYLSPVPCDHRTRRGRPPALRRGSDPRPT